MKGIIFNLAEEVVRTGFGEDTWDGILAGADLDGSWTSLGSYPDEELFRLVRAAAALLDVDEASVLRIVAEGAIPLLFERYPEFFTPHADARSFVLTLNDIIHPEVLKLYPGAEVPVFSYHPFEPDGLLLGYVSGRRLCVLAEGFVGGAAMHYGQTVTIEHRACMSEGAEQCLLHCEFHRVGS